MDWEHIGVGSIEISDLHAKTGTKSLMMTFQDVYRSSERKRPSAGPMPGSVQSGSW